MCFISVALSYSSLATTLTGIPLAGADFEQNAGNKKYKNEELPKNMIPSKSQYKISGNERKKTSMRLPYMLFCVSWCVPLLIFTLCHLLLSRGGGLLDALAPN